MQNYTEQNEKKIPYQQNSFQYHNVELKCSIIMNKIKIDIAPPEQFQRYNVQMKYIILQKLLIHR
jgi:hypothetical protein